MSPAIIAPAEPARPSVAAWPLPEGVLRVTAAAAKAAGLVLLSVRFDAHERKPFRQMLTGLLTSGQYRAEEIRVVLSPHRDACTLARTGVKAKDVAATRMLSGSARVDVRRARR